MMLRRIMFSGHTPPLQALIATCVRWAAVLLAIAGTASYDAKAEPRRTRRFIYNSDGGNIFVDKAPPMTPEDV